MCEWLWAVLWFAGMLCCGAIRCCCLSSVVTQDLTSDGSLKGNSLANLSALLTLQRAEEVYGFQPDKFGLTEAEAADIAGVFARFDVNEDGQLEQSELRNLWWVSFNTGWSGVGWCDVGWRRVGWLGGSGVCWRVLRGQTEWKQLNVPVPALCCCVLCVMFFPLSVPACLLFFHLPPHSSQLGTDISEAEAKEAVRVLDESNTGYVQFADFVEW